MWTLRLNAGPAPVAAADDQRLAFAPRVARWSPGGCCRSAETNRSRGPCLWMWTGGGHPAALSGADGAWRARLAPAEVGLAGSADSHLHLLSTAAAQLSTDCSPRGAPSIAAVLARLTSTATALRRGSWLRVWGFDDALTPAHRNPTVAELYRAVPDRSAASAPHTQRLPRSMRRQQRRTVGCTQTFKARAHRCGAQEGRVGRIGVGHDQAGQTGRPGSGEARSGVLHREHHVAR